MFYRSSYVVKAPGHDFFKKNIQKIIFEKEIKIVEIS